MAAFEYKVVPAPKRGLKARGVKTPEARFANAIETLMNDLGAEGWEFQRSDTLPNEERQGLTGRSTEFRTILVFRRPLDDDLPPEDEPPALIEDKSTGLEPDPEPAPETEGPDRESLFDGTEETDRPLNG